MGNPPKYHLYTKTCQIKGNAKFLDVKYIYIEEKYILAFLFFNIALLTVVHELQNPLMLSTNALPSRVPRRMKIRKISAKQSPKITALT